MAYKLKRVGRNGMTKETWRELSKKPSADYVRVRQNDLAIQYARWLANRDFRVIPTNTWPTVAFAYANDDWKDTRPCAVEWWREAGPQRETVLVRRIEIPNWDWTPAPVVEEYLPEVIAA